MKIALLAPAGAMHRYSGSFGKSLHYAPLTLTTLAALVPEEADAEITIYDETAGKIPLDIDADLIGITCITGTAPRCYAFADYYRKKGITVFMGGVHPSMLPGEAAQHADVVFTGFSEQTFPQFIRDYMSGSFKKLYAQNCDFTIANRPLPRRELLNKKRYITINTVEAIRGCCHRCSFCAYPAAFGHPVYKRPVKEVIAEIEALHSRHVLFPDVNLIADRAYAIELFSAMIPLKLMWVGLVTSAVGIDDELITVFRKSGCKGLLIGFESITQESQQYIHKGVNRVDGYIDLMKRLHDNGILVQGCFAFGGDEEDTSVFERTVETVIKAKIDLPRYSILTPFPRTELYAQLEREGRIMERNWAMYDVQHCVFKPRKMTKEQLEEGTDLAWRLTYSTGNIMKRLAPLRHSPWLSIPLNLGYKGYADKWHKFTREVMCDNSDIRELRRIDMKITFILPAIGKKQGQKYIGTWKMEPLTVAVLKALTPKDVETELFDDRIELLDYNTKTDLVCITVETYTAKRSYRIAARFRERGIPVVMGGYHATICPEETEQYCDSVIVGNAETVWRQMLGDAKNRFLQKRYVGGTGTYGVSPDKSIFTGKKYLPVSLVETGRGCNHNCEFCSISRFYDSRYHARSHELIEADIAASPYKYFFLVDDNLVANRKNALELFRRIEPLHIKWAGQGTLSMAKDPELLRAMKKSGCEIILIGFESLDKANLRQMNKSFNYALGERDELVQRVHDAGIGIYATFVFGYDNDDEETVAQALAFSKKHNFYTAAFNHLLPFPNTRLYDRLKQENRLIYDKWWLADGYNYGELSFVPKKITPEGLSKACRDARKEFSSFKTVMSRGFASLGRTSPLLWGLFWGMNLRIGGEVDQKMNVPIGENLDELPK